MRERVAIVGVGFVGLATALVYVRHGYETVGLDRNVAAVELLNQGIPSFYEPGLQLELSEGLQSGRLRFSSDAAETLRWSTVVIICVGTPPQDDGRADLSALWTVTTRIREHANPGTVVILKSTIPLGTYGEVNRFLTDAENRPIELACMPEFLREGQALSDAANPDVVVIGSDDQATRRRLVEFNKGFGKERLLAVSGEAAMLIKYANNVHGAMRIVFINELADLCERYGATVDEVITGLSYSKTVNDYPFYPGLGYGGSCFPKDVSALAAQTREFKEDDLFTRLEALNAERPYRLLNAIGNKRSGGWMKARVAVLGLSFKPSTDDQRCSPASIVIPYLLGLGAQVVSYDPVVQQIDVEAALQDSRYEQVGSICEAIDGADVVMPLIEWKQIVQFDFVWHRFRAKPSAIFADMRNQFDQDRLVAAGWEYRGIGR